MNLESLSLQELDEMEAWAEELFKDVKPGGPKLGMKLLHVAVLRGIRAEKRTREVEHTDIRACHYDHVKD
jgi:hypothetical protein